MRFPPAEARVSAAVSTAEEDFTAAGEEDTDERKSTDFGKSIEGEGNDV
jgi:hypothetical protein